MQYNIDIFDEIYVVTCWDSCVLQWLQARYENTLSWYAKSKMYYNRIRVKER